MQDSSFLMDHMVHELDSCAIPFLWRVGKVPSTPLWCLRVMGELSPWCCGLRLVV